MRFLLLYVLLLVSVCSSGQYVIGLKQYGVKEGLSHRQVNAVLKDRRGFLWVGTHYGLNRFDGYGFVWYTQEKNGLPFNDIQQLATDGDGNIWIRGGNLGSAVAVLDPSTGTALSLKAKLHSTADYAFDHLQSCKDGSIVFYRSNDQFIWRFIPGKGLVKEKLAPGLITPVNATASLVGKDSWWFERPEAIEQYDLTGRLLYRFKTQPRDGLFAQNTAVGFKDERQHYFFIKPDKQVVDVTSALPKFDSTAGDMLFFTGMDDLYWRQGKLFSLRRGILADFGQQGYTDLKGFLRTILPDGSGRLWIGNNFGLYRLDITFNRFSQYFFGKTAVNNTSNSYRGIVVDKGKLIACNEIQSIVQGPSDPEKAPSVFFKNKQDEIYYSLIKSGEQELIAGGAHNVYVIKPGGHTTSLPLKGEYSACWAIREVSKNQFLLGLQQGLMWLDREKMQLQNFTSYNRYPELAKAHVLDIRSFDGQQYWICTNRGLFVFDQLNGVTQRYSRDDADDSFLPSNEFQHIMRDTDGIYWLATTGGLIRWEKEKNKVRLFTRTDGLSNNNIYAVYDDAKGHVWLSSDYGIMQLNKTTFAVKAYSTDDGLTNEEFNRISHFQDSSGRIYFGSLSGITAFHPKDFEPGTKSKEQLSLVITSLQKFDGGKLVDHTASVLSDNTIELYPSDYYLSLEVALMNFESPEHTTYYWTTGQSNASWNVQKERTLHFGQMPYGTTILRIKAQAPDGQWSSNELRIAIISYKPFYLQWWFLLLSALALFCGLYLRIRWNTRRLKKENKLLDETISQRTNDLQVSLQQKDLLLKEIHHRVKNNLQVISSLLELQTATSGQNEAVRAAITEGQNRVKSIALIHQRLYQHEQVSAIEFSAFIQELFHQIASVLKNPGQHIQTHFSVPETYLDIDTAVPLGLICNEIITNSFKYGFSQNAAPCFTASLTQKGKWNYELELADNGAGLPKNFDLKKSDTLGLKLIRRLSRQIGGEALYLNENGAKFIIRFCETGTDIYQN